MDVNHRVLEFTPATEDGAHVWDERWSGSGAIFWRRIDKALLEVDDKEDGGRRHFPRCVILHCTRGFGCLD